MFHALFGFYERIYLTILNFNIQSADIKSQV